MSKFQPSKKSRLKSRGQVYGILFLLEDIREAPLVWEELEHGHAAQFSCTQLRNLYTLKILFHVFKYEVFSLMLGR